jgi:uncharacterized protein (TIRG00374 family)
MIPTDDQPEEPPEPPAAAPTATSRRVRRTLQVLVAAFVVHTFVLPQIAGARAAVHLVAGLNPWLVLLALGFEVVSLAAYAQTTRVLLDSAELSLRRSSAVVLSSLAVGHVVPAGGAASSVVTVRLLTASGVNATDATFVLATQGVGSAIVLNALWWVTLVVAVPLSGFHRTNAIVAGIGAIVIGAIGLAVLRIVRGGAAGAHRLARMVGRLPKVDPDRLEAGLVQASGRLRALSTDRRRLARAVALAALNWVADAACLWTFLAAFGRVAPVDQVLVAYGLAYVLAAIPISPGGLGIVEATLTASLVGLGNPRGAVTLAVVGYRLVNFWLPIPVGAAAYVSLRADSRRRPVRTMVRDALDEQGPPPGTGGAPEPRPEPT